MAIGSEEEDWDPLLLTAAQSPELHAAGLRFTKGRYGVHILLRRALFSGALAAINTKREFKTNRTSARESN